MREIKFRGKRADNGQWVYGSLVAGKYIMTAEQARRFDIGGWIEGQMHEVIPETVGQFTGLHDMNGKEIYEGDLFKNPHIKGRYEVAWSEGADCACYWCFDEETGFSPREVAVIGNIHDQEDIANENS